MLPYHTAIAWPKLHAHALTGHGEVAIVPCHRSKDAARRGSKSHETSALRIRLPSHDQRSAGAACQSQRRGKAPGRWPERDADDGVSHRTTVAAGGFEEAAGPQG